MLEALIPYVTAPEKTLIDNLPVIGPLKLQFFGPLVAVGVILGWKQCLKYAKAKNIDEFFFRDYLFWMLVFAFVISHWVSVIFYFPEQVKENPMVLLTVWSGLSSVGGFFGAFVGMTYYLKKHKQPIIVYADATIYGLLVGWCFGRAGCSLVHDHPGQVVSEGAPPTEGLASWLAVGPWPPESHPTWRYDLGLLELMFAITLCTFLYVVGKPLTRKPGWLVGTVVMAYAPFRFCLDFLRANEAARGVISSPDLRYSGLTPAQWFCIAFFCAGLYLVFFRKAKPEDLDYKKDSDRVARENAAAAEADRATAKATAKPKPDAKPSDEADAQETAHD